MSVETITENMRNTMKIFDCSINGYAPAHRVNSFGNVENDMMSALKKYATQLGISFVDKYNKADCIITNTTYTPDIIKSGIPLVKRMDGVFWRTDLIERNKLLNEAAIKSDVVIFISEFSKRSFHKLYTTDVIKKEFVVLNNVDENIFYQIKPNNNDIIFWGTSATNWERKEKRGDDLLRFADIIDKNEKIILIGVSNITHKNIINVGYFNDYAEMNIVINNCDAWINLSYRDAAPKSVIQAIKCGKPILYADSGGLKELVGNFGLPINDDKEIYFDSDNSDLDFENVKKSYYRFKSKYYNHSFKQESAKKYLDTLTEYVDIFKTVTK